MKYILILTLLCSMTHAQEGIGLLLFGKNKQVIIKELEKQLDTELKVVSSNKDYFYYIKKPKIILQGKKSEEDPYFSQYSECNEVSIIYVNGYKIKDIELSELEITFYNDSLAFIYLVPNSNFIDAFTAKYGEGKAELVDKKIQCRYNLTGITTENTETKITTTWNVRNCSAFSTLNKTYNKKCNPEYNRQFFFYLYEKSLKINDCESNARNTRLDIKKDKKVDGF